MSVFVEVRVNSILLLLLDQLVVIGCYIVWQRAGIHCSIVTMYEELIEFCIMLCWRLKWL